MAFPNAYHISFHYFKTHTHVRVETIIHPNEDMLSSSCELERTTSVRERNSVLKINITTLTTCIPNIPSNKSFIKCFALNLNIFSNYIVEKYFERHTRRKLVNNFQLAAIVILYLNDFTVFISLMQH